MAEATLRTETILDQLVAGKREDLATRIATEPLRAVRSRAALVRTPLPFAAPLRGPRIGLIAEIKRASPTAGMLEDEFDPVVRACAYAQGGAAAISVLTEERRFLGSLDDLTAVRGALLAERREPRPPLLRKDFLFDPYHLYEARAAGADAVLLIVAILEQAALVDLLALAAELGLGALVEVHDEHELERALAANAQLIGINNRDLRTFTTDLGVTERLVRQIPRGPVLVSESGIRDRADIERLSRAGADAILVGEALMRSGDVLASAREFSGVPRVADTNSGRNGAARDELGTR